MVLLGLLGACSGANKDGLSDGAHSLEGVAEAMLTRLSQGDHEGLVAMLVTQREHDQFYWPALPESRGAGATDPNFAFENLRLHTLRDLGRVERDLAERRTREGSLRLRLVSVRADRTPYPAMTMHRHLQVTVRVNDGFPETLPLSGSILERDGRWKPLSYRR